MFYPKSLSIIFAWYVFTLGWTWGIVCESATIDLSQSDAYSMYYVGISGVREWIECIKWNALDMLFAEANSHTHTHTHTHKCTLIFDIRYLICVAWLILLGMLFGSAKIELIPKSQLFYSNITQATLAQFDFCTLANNALCSSKCEHIPHKNDTKWFGMKHSFIRCIIIYCS